LLSFSHRLRAELILGMPSESKTFDIEKRKLKLSSEDPAI